MAFAIRTIYIFRELRLAIGCHGISCNIDLKRNQAEIEQNDSTSPPLGSPPGSPQPRLQSRIYQERVGEKDDKQRAARSQKPRHPRYLGY